MPIDVSVTSPLTSEDAGPAATGRNLVPIAPPADAGHGHPYSRPSAVFLAHLIGTAQGAPQSRARRRTGAADASAVYEGVALSTAAATCHLRGSL
jgi:hypothetical protein